MNADEEEVPDPIDPDLPEHLQAILRWRWLDLIDRMKIPPHRKAVAKALARFGDADGSNVFPGAQKIADIANCDDKTARGHIKALVAAGMLAVKRRGGGRGGATHVYRLTRPTDLTSLPLWLDPDFNRIPDGAAFVPVAAEEHRAPAPSEATEYRAPAPGEYPFDDTEYRASAPSETPVDNPADRETPGVRSRNTGNSAPKHRAPRQPTIFITPPKTKEPAWLLQVSTSLGESITAPSPDAWTPEAAPAPRIVRGTATLQPTPEAAAAFAILTALPNDGEWFRAAAGRELRDEGHPEPTVQALAIRAAEILRRTDPETRSA